MSPLIVSLLLVLTVAHVYAQSAATTDQTECQAHRTREMSSTNKVPGRVIPECDESGAYKALQCHGESTNGQRFCQCWTTDGSPVTSPSRNTKTCDCHMVRYQSTRRARIGRYSAQCERDGSFKKKQCHGSTGMCWCVNPANEQVGEKQRNPNLTCN